MYCVIQIIDYTDENKVTTTVQCPLVPVVSIYMIRNALLSTNARSAMTQRHWNRMQLLASTKPEQGLIANSMDSNLVLKGTIYDHDVVYDKNTKEFLITYLNKDLEEEQHTYASVGKVNGHADTSWGEHQTYLARGLRNDFFQTALQMPYYQGMLLYFLSVFYPFLALIVILPSHAQNIFYLPLAWFWVKSWDIGFALVMVLEKVLWEMLPNTDLELGFLTVDGLEGAPVPNVLTKSLEVDPSYHLHSYYFMIGLVLFAIPNITGYAILRAKSSILSSFTNGMRRIGKEARDKAESSYGIARISSKQQAITERQGIAMMANSRGVRMNAAIRSGSAGAGSLGQLMGAIQSSISPAANKVAGRAQAIETRLTMFGQATNLKNLVNNPKSVAKGLANSTIAFENNKLKKANNYENTLTSYRAETAGLLDQHKGIFGSYAILARAALSAQEAQASEDPFSDAPPSGFSAGFDAGDVIKGGDGVDAAMNVFFKLHEMKVKAKVSGASKLGEGWHGSSGDLRNALMNGRKEAFKEAITTVSSVMLGTLAHVYKEGILGQDVHSWTDDLLESRTAFQMSTQLNNRDGRIARRIIVDNQTMQEDKKDTP